MSDGNCSFCGKSHTEVFRLITGEACKICSECVGRMANIVAGELQRASDDILTYVPPAASREPGEPQP